jgi:hypothetical protein
MNMKMRKVVNDCKKSVPAGVRGNDRIKFVVFSLFILLALSGLCYLMGDASGILTGGPLDIAFLGGIIANCDEKVAHTGRDNCPKAEDATAGLLITKLSAVYPASATEFNEELQGNIVSTGVKKMWPVMDIKENTATGGDPKTSDIGFGGPTPTGINAFSVVYRIAGGDCLYKELMNLDRLQVRVFRIAKDGYIYGTIALQKTGATQTEVFRGFDATIKVYRQGATGADPYGLYIAVYYSANYEKELSNLYAFELDEMPQGLVAVKLKAGPDTKTARVVSTCSGSDYTSEFGDLWAAAMFADASGAVPSSVTYNEGTNLLTFGTTGTYRVRNAFTLNAGGIYGLDGLNELTVIS